MVGDFVSVGNVSVKNLTSDNTASSVQATTFANRTTVLREETVPCVPRVSLRY